MRLFNRFDYVLLAIIIGLWLLAVWLWPREANAQNMPDWIMNGNDRLEIEPFGNADALVKYHNHASMASGGGASSIAVIVGDVQIVVDVWIEVNGDGQSEVATVTPRNGYIAIPDRLSVKDGETGEFRVMLPMF